jgi:hypothetical protein
MIPHSCTFFLVASRLLLNLGFFVVKALCLSNLFIHVLVPTCTEFEIPFFEIFLSVIQKPIFFVSCKYLISRIFVFFCLTSPKIRISQSQFYLLTILCQSPLVLVHSLRDALICSVTSYYNVENLKLVHASSVLSYYQESTYSDLICQSIYQ